MLRLPHCAALGEADDYEALLQLDESVGGAVATGMSTTEMRALKVRTLEEEVEDAECNLCCICCCDFVKGDKLMTLQCGHEYHPECIATWLRAKRVCPTCKQPAALDKDEP